MVLSTGSWPVWSLILSVSLLPLLASAAPPSPPSVLGEWEGPYVVSSGPMSYDIGTATIADTAVQRVAVYKAAASMYYAVSPSHTVNFTAAQGTCSGSTPGIAMSFYSPKVLTMEDSADGTHWLVLLLAGRTSPQPSRRTTTLFYSLRNLSADFALSSDFFPRCYSTNITNVGGSVEAVYQPAHGGRPGQLVAVYPVHVEPSGNQSVYDSQYTDGWVVTAELIAGELLWRPAQPMLSTANTAPSWQAGSSEVHFPTTWENYLLGTPGAGVALFSNPLDGSVGLVHASYGTGLLWTSAAPQLTNSWRFVCTLPSMTGDNLTVYNDSFSGFAGTSFQHGGYAFVGLVYFAYSGVSYAYSLLNLSSTAAAITALPSQAIAVEAATAKGQPTVDFFADRLIFQYIDYTKKPEQAYAMYSTWASAAAANDTDEVSFVQSSRPVKIGPLIGIVTGVLALVLITGLAIVLLHRRQRRTDSVKASHTSVQGNRSGSGVTWKAALLSSTNTASNTASSYVDNTRFDVIRDK